MSDNPTQRRYSEDGSHWWDGRAWQPVQAAQPVQAPQPPPSGTRPVSTAPPPPGTPPVSTAPPPPDAAPRRRAPLVVALVVVGLIALVAGDSVGETVAKRTTVPVDVSGPPRIPDGFPDAGQRYLTGVTVPQVTEDWLGKDGLWTCEESSIAPMNAAHEMDCKPSDEDLSFLFRVFVSYDGEDQVTSMSAQCDLGPDAKPCSQLFRNLCDVVFSEDHGTAKKAKKWVRQNMDSDSPAVFGDVHIWMPLQGDHASIHVQAAA